MDSRKNKVHKEILGHDLALNSCVLIFSIISLISCVFYIFDIVRLYSEQKIFGKVQRSYKRKS